MTPWSFSLFATSLALFSSEPRDPDTDGDGLTDFRETHKHFTDPARADSDGDGTPDGDWDERREFTYTVRALVQVLPPVTPGALCDDYQDARILERTDGYVELEVILYPLNTVAEAIVADPDWRVNAAPMQKWAQPGLTANWDEPMRRAIVAQLAGQGIDAAALDDRTLVERAAPALLDHAQYVDGFTTFCSRFVDGRVEVHPGLEDTARRGQSSANLTLEQQWQRELFARGMYEHGVRGSCTSTAIYLAGCLRALGVPTRLVLAIPIVDATDDREPAMVGRLRNHRVRYVAERGVAALQQGWTSHTFNEAFVGGRWRRLNGDRLGQNILDANLFGLMIHVATFDDWADGEMSSTWGLRQKSSPTPDDPFGGGNPYSTLSISDRFGPHAKLANEPHPEEFTRLTIDEAHWLAERPAGIEMDVDESESAGHVIVRVEEGRPGEGAAQYSSFYKRVPKDFVLRADGHPDVPLVATRGYWAQPEQGIRHFYLKIEPDAFAQLALGVEYALRPAATESQYRWDVREGVTLTRTLERIAPLPPNPSPAEREPKVAANAGDGSPNAAADGSALPAPAGGGDAPPELTIDQLFWSDAPDCPTGRLGDGLPVLLARVGSSSDFDSIKRFTEQADNRFFLEADGHPTLKVGSGVGGVTTREHTYAVIVLGPGDWHELAAGVEYTLRAQNETEFHRWKITAGQVPARAR